MPRFTAFLDQARWLLEQQQRRSTNLQQTAVALIGFDGVLLAVLVSGDSLSTSIRHSTSWWTTVIGAGLIVMSSIAGVMAIRPRPIYVAGADLTVDEWAKLHTEATWDRATQHFAEMLLAADPPLTDTSTRVAHVVAWWRTKLRRAPLPRQPILAAEHLSNVRARWSSWAGWLLVAGLACLAATLATTTEPAGVASRQEATSSQALSHEIGEP